MDGRRITEILTKLLLVELGWYTWEIIVQLPFDWSVVSRKVHLALFCYPLCPAKLV